MGEIQYENQQTGLPNAPRPPEEPDLIQRLMKWGIVSTPQQAQFVLLGFVMLAVCLTLYFSAKVFGGSANYSAGELGNPITTEHVQ